MTETSERKDLIYPANDTVDLTKEAQFDSDSTSPSHNGGQPNGVVPNTTTPIQINGFSSEEDSEDDSKLITISQSCGQGESKGESTLTKGLLTGKYIEIPRSQDLIVDERIQSTYTLFTKPNSKSLPRKSLSSVNERQVKSNQSSPSHSAHLQPSGMGNYHNTSPEVGRRIKSNPFFVQDRLSRSTLNPSDRQRLDSAPAKVNMRIDGSLERTGVSQSASALSANTENSTRMSSSKSFCMNTGSPSRKAAEHAVTVDIQSRIKLWAEKEREAKESKEQELERIRSPTSQKTSPSKEEENSNDKNQSTQLKKLVKVLKHIEPSDQGNGDKTTKQRKTSKEKQLDQHSSSSSRGSPTRARKGVRSRTSRKGSKDSSSDQTPDNSPKKNRWKIKSPLFRRKKSGFSESQSFDSELSDENLLTGSEEQLATGKKTGNGKSPAHNKISSRSSSKRKAVKKRISSTFGLPTARSNSDCRAFDDQAIPSKSPSIMAHELRPRSNSVGPKLRLKIHTQGRAVSQPDIVSLTVSPSSPKADASSFEQDNTKKTALAKESEDLTPVVVRECKGRKTKEAKDRTISRDIRDIIDSLGTGSLVRSDSDPILEQVTEECTKAEMNGFTECSLARGSSLDIVIEPPADESNPPVQLSDTEETFIPRGGSLQECGGPIMTSLDIGKTRRALIKRRLSDSTRINHGINKIQKGHPQLRVGSLSPTEDTSEGGVIATSLMYADAVWDRVALEDDELSFSVGDAIEILDMTDDVWWYGSVDSANGWFPASFVRLRIGQDSDGDTDSVISTDPSSSSPPPTHDTPPPPQPTTEPPPRVHDDEKPTEDKVGELQSHLDKRRPSRNQSVHRRMTIRRKDSAPSKPRKLTSTEVRAKVIEEIVSTERDYVKHLEDIIEGYVKQCRKHNKLFDEDKVETIFSNVEAIYSFQKDFLQELEASLNRDKMEDTQIGEVFVNNRHEFDIYCLYCNNHPHAVNEMNQLQENEQYTFFFESCRLLRNLQDISLEGFLLTPVQRICKYPLQLTELLKYTSEEHPDYPHVVAARDAMREVAMHINEMKRRMENIGKIGRWQATIEGWKGEDILEASSQMLRCGELHKISKGRSQERHFFLFDHQLIYCKKDAIGGKLTYKGRVYLDQCQITDMEDGTAIHSGSVVKNAWRMNNKAKDNKWYIIFARSSEEKRAWMDAFTKERDLIKDDEETKFQVSLRMKKSAVALCASAEQSRRGRRKSSSVPSKNRALVESVDAASKHKIGSQKLTTSASSPLPKSRTMGRKKRGSNS